MPITRAIENISAETALEILASSNRSPTVTASPELEQATVDVLNSVPDTPAFPTDIVLTNGYVVYGYEELSVIANSDKTVTAWVRRENTLQREEEVE